MSSPEILAGLVREAASPTTCQARRDVLHRELLGFHRSPERWAVAAPLYLQGTDPFCNLWSLDYFASVIRAGRWLEVPESSRAELKNALAHAVAAPATGSPGYVRRKVAEVLAAVFGVEWPTTWPALLPDLLTLARTTQSPDTLEMFFYVLNEIDQQFTAHNAAGVWNAGEPNNKAASHNMAVKDAIRDHCMVDMVAVWMHLLRTYRASTPAVAAATLKSLCPYISWFDLTAVLTEEFLGMLYGYIRTPGPLVAPAMQCLTEFVYKGMPVAAKMGLIDSIKVIEALTETRGVWVEDLEAAQAVSRLLQVAGGCISDATGTPSAPEAALMLLRFQPLVVVCLSHEFDDVAEDVVTFAHALVHQLPVEHGDKVEQLVVAVLRKMQYEPDYDWANPDEEELAFDRFRAGLKTVFLAAARRFQHAVGTLLASQLALYSSISQEAIAAAPYPELEALLAAMHWLGEGAEKTIRSNPNHPAHEAAKALLASAVSSHPHPAVRETFFEVALRFSKFLTGFPGLAGPVVAALCDSRGVFSELSSLANRAAYIFVKLSRSERPAIAPHLEAIMSTVGPALAPGGPGAGMAHDTRSYLFEALSELLGSTTVDPTQRATTVRALVASQVAELGAVATEGRYSLDNQAAHPAATRSANAIDLLVKLSKGFNSPKLETYGLVETFTSCVPTVLQMAEIHRGYTIVRARVCAFIRRGMESLGVAFVSALGPCVSVLLSTASEHGDYLVVPGIVSQAVRRFGAESAPALETIWGPLVDAVLGVCCGTDPKNDPNLASVQKTLSANFGVLFSTTLECKELASIPKSHRLEETMALIGVCAVAVGETPSLKAALATVSSTIGAWGAGPLAVAGLDSWVLGESGIFPSVIVAMAGDSFEHLSASNSQVYTTLGRLLVACCAVWDPMMLEQSLQVLSGTLSIPLQNLSPLHAAAVAGNRREVSSLIRQMVSFTHSSHK